MGKKELREQQRLIKAALSSADLPQLRATLGGTLGDTRSFCWATLRQFDRRDGYTHFSKPQDHALDHAEKHMLLVIAHDTVRHVEVVEMLLARIGSAEQLPPDSALREQLREARNLLAEHRDERVLYWRLTAQHTPHVAETYQRLGVALPNKTIDSEIIAYASPPDASDEDIAQGSASVGMIGGILSLNKLRDSFRQLERDLDRLATRFR